MTYRGSLPSGQGYGGGGGVGGGGGGGRQQQQQMPGSFDQIYGNGQAGTYGGGVGGYAAPTAQQPSPQAMQFGGDPMMDGSTYFQSFEGGSFDGGYHQHQHQQHHQSQFSPTALPPSHFQQQPFVQPVQVPANLYPLQAFSSPSIAPAQLQPQPQTQPQRQPPPLQYVQPSAMGNAVSNSGNAAINSAAIAGNTAAPVPANYHAAEASRAKPSPKPTSLANSPALSTKSSIAGPATAPSPGISKRSPALPAKDRPPPPFKDPVPVLVAVAEDCFATAHRAAAEIARSPDEGAVREYQRLISTGLACLEAALQSNKLGPRQEAKTRLRYAMLLCEETENLMDAETTLTRGITLCDKHRYLDLKYCMQYLLLRVLFQRNQKAALKATESHISDAMALRHIHWIYAFRFLKASFYMQSTNPSDSAALENLRSTAALATQRGDKALIVFASLLEALTLMKTVKADTIERVQACIAQVSKYQLDPSVRIPQLELLTLLVDLACCMHRKHPDTLVQKLKQLDSKLTDNQEQQTWDDSMAEVLLPIRKPQSASATISPETAGVLRQGADGTMSDHLVMSFVTKTELWALCMAVSGLASSSAPSNRPGKNIPVFEEGLKSLVKCASEKLPLASLQQSIRRESWRKSVYSYLQILIGLNLATQSRWAEVKECMDNIQASILPSFPETVRLLSRYLSGCFHQGTGDIETAFEIFTDHFKINDNETGAVRSTHLDICLLASMNRLWIMQHPSFRNAAATAELIERLRPLCADHNDPEMRAAFHLILATVAAGQEPAINQVKANIGQTLNISRSTGNHHFLAISLCIMRQRLFEKVVGDQAIKAARAASHQAQKDGNLLWRSVADGMLAQSFEIVGMAQQAAAAYRDGVKHGSLAFSGNVQGRT